MNSIDYKNMTTVFQQIIDVSNKEDEVRSSPDTISNSMIHQTTIKSLEYVDGNFGNKIVLTGSKVKEVITDDNFNMEFSKKTFDLLTYVHWDNIVVAGGSLVNIITKCADKVNDIDVFVYGLDRDAAKAKIDHVISSIKQKAIDMKYDTRVYMNKNVINIYVFDTKKLLQVQIILRLYDTLAHVLVGFDVDCCCVCYDGKNISVSDRGFYALKHRVNVANLKRRSPSYENRLIKYSFRGFDVVTDFDYESVYNKMFFMSSENYGFTRLLEQELINNGQLKNIIFSNTLRFRQTASYTSNHSVYAKENLEIKDIRNTENCITKFNANIEDDSMKFKEYNIKSIELMETNVTEQFTGSFCPLTDENWVTGKADGAPNSDPLARSDQFIRLKYNKYKTISEFENLEISDISNFDAKCLAVMYVENDSDVVRIVENKYIPKTNNMYRISPVQLAILLGRTKLAMKLMKGHSYETMKELIYMMDNDKLFTNYCNSIGRSCTDVDKALVAKFECENISDNIHNQNKGNNNLDEFYTLAGLDMMVKIASGLSPLQYGSYDVTKLPFDVIKFLYEKGNLTYATLLQHIVKKFKDDDLKVLGDALAEDEKERDIFRYVVKNFISTEEKRCKKTNDNIKKLLVVKNQWNDDLTYSSVHEEFNKLNAIHANLYTCMLNIRDRKMTFELVKMLVGTTRAFDALINYVLFLDDTEILQKLISKDDLYVKLKYQYKVEGLECPRVREFFDKIDKERQHDKVKTNNILKNTDDHVNALVDGDLSEGYSRQENVFGMTPDDNIVAKLLLMFNKVFNKGEAMNDKDKTTLKNMRKSIHNIRRNSEHKIVNNRYFYSLKLHNLFFSKSTDDKDDEVSSDESEKCDDVVEVQNDDIEGDVDDVENADSVEDGGDYESDYDDDCEEDCASYSDDDVVVEDDEKSYKSG
jgi:hypothetical protein